MENTIQGNEAQNLENTTLADVLSKLDQVIILCEKNEKSFEENGMEYMSITSGAMGQAYRITRGWLQNIR